MEERFALSEIGRIDRQVRGHSAWYGVFCLVLAGAVAAYVVVSHMLGAGHPAVAGLILGALVVLGAIYWRYGHRQELVSRTQARLDLPMGIASIVLIIVALILRQAFVPDGFNAELLAVALLPALPCLAGAWQVFRP